MEQVNAKQRELFSQWKRIYENGCDSGCEVPDGLILNQIRAEILEIARKTTEEKEEALGGCAAEIPPLLEKDYMARREEIRRFAVSVLGTVRESAQYKRLLQLKRQAENAGCVPEQLQMAGLADRLADAVEHDDLCRMHCLSRPDEINAQIEEGINALTVMKEKRQKQQQRLLKRGQITGQFSIYDLSA